MQIFILVTQNFHGFSLVIKFPSKREPCGCFSRVEILERTPVTNAPDSTALMRISLVLLLFGCRLLHTRAALVYTYDIPPAIRFDGEYNIDKNSCDGLGLPNIYGAAAKVMSQSGPSLLGSEVVFPPSCPPLLMPCRTT